MRRLLLLAALAGGAALSACATGGPVTAGGAVPAAARADAVARAAGADAPTAARWHEGERLFSSRCQRCHALPVPGSVDPGKWPTEVQEMSRKSGLSGEQIALVTEYLVAAAKATRATN